MENPTLYLIEKIQSYFLGTASKGYATSLIKLHNCKLSHIGDISFPLKPDIWQNYFKITLNCEGDTIFNLTSDTAEDSMQKLLKCSQTWTFPLAEIKILKDRCALFLNRKTITEKLLNQVLVAKNYGVQSKNPQKIVRIIDCKSTDAGVLSEYRARLVHKTLKKLVNLSEWTEVNDSTECNLKNVGVISVVTKRPNIETDESVVVLRCGTVLDPHDGKLARILPEDYIGLRSTDMRLMAMHKYGIRVKDDQKFCQLFNRLGEAAVTVDLLEVKPSSPVQMIRSGQGSTKGASFILYNSARLETLLRSFDERVEKRIYEQLPPLSDIDFGLLCSEEEWELIYGYIFTFPNLINRCIENFDSGSCGIHYLIKYLEGLVSAFSVYYRRIRILTETRTHLMPHVYARIYLLKAIREVFNMTLALLDIEPVQFM